MAGSLFESARKNVFMSPEGPQGLKFPKSMSAFRFTPLKCAGSFLHLGERFSYCMGEAPT